MYTRFKIQKSKLYKMYNFKSIKTGCSSSKHLVSSDQVPFSNFLQIQPLLFQLLEFNKISEILSHFSDIKFHLLVYTHISNFH